METSWRKPLPAAFPAELRATAHSLASVGSWEWAWNYENAIKAVNAFVDAGYAILGGDVSHEAQGSYTISYDNWSMLHTEMSDSDLLEASRKQASAYIQDYHTRYGDAYVYVLVATDEKRLWR